MSMVEVVQVDGGGTRRVFSGTVEVCCHRVSFWYEIHQHKDTEELRERLTEEAESRAEACIIDGCGSGELNCLYEQGDADPEIRGWFEIVREGA